MPIVDLASADAADKSRRLPKIASPAAHSPFFRTFCALLMSLFFSLGALLALRFVCFQHFLNYFCKTGGYIYPPQLGGS
jgi:hypothetical protein